MPSTLSKFTDGTRQQGENGQWPRNNHGQGVRFHQFGETTHRANEPFSAADGHGAGAGPAGLRQGLRGWPRMGRPDAGAGGPQQGGPAHYQGPHSNGSYGGGDAGAAMKYQRQPSMDFPQQMPHGQQQQQDLPHEEQHQQQQQQQLQQQQQQQLLLQQQQQQNPLQRVLMLQQLIHQVQNECLNMSLQQLNNVMAQQRQNMGLPGNSTPTAETTNRPGRQVDETNVYVSHLPQDMGHEAFSELMSRYGTVLSSRVLNDEKFAKKGVRSIGFARMGSKEEALAAIKGVHLLKLPQSAIPLRAKLAFRTIRGDDIEESGKTSDGPSAPMQDQALMPTNPMAAPMGAIGFNNMPVSPNPQVPANTNNVPLAQTSMAEFPQRLPFLPVAGRFLPNLGGLFWNHGANNGGIQGVSGDPSLMQGTGIGGYAGYFGQVQNTGSHAMMNGRSDTGGDGQQIGADVEDQQQRLPSRREE